MDVAEKMESALADILPVYGCTPEFGANAEPEKYAVYNITEFPRECNAVPVQARGVYSGAGFRIVQADKKGCACGGVRVFLRRTGRNGHAVPLRHALLP